MEGRASVEQSLAPAPSVFFFFFLGNLSPPPGRSADELPTSLSGGSPSGLRGANNSALAVALPTDTASERISFILSLGSKGVPFLSEFRSTKKRLRDLWIERARRLGLDRRVQLFVEAVVVCLNGVQLHARDVRERAGGRIAAADSG